MKNRYSEKKKKIQIIIVIIFLSFPKLYSCGGGVVPYVPTQTGASGASTATSQFFIFEKGVAIDMFDIKKHQPIFRNIVLSGNERKEHKTTVEKSESDSSAVSADSASVAKEVTPVLNLHRLH